MAIGTTLKIAFDGSSVQKGMGGIMSSMKKIASIGGIVTGVFTAIGAAVSVVASGAVIAGMAAFAKSASRAAAEMESMQTAFTVLVGDAQKASDILEDIRQYGASTPFGQADLKEAIKTLLAFGVEADDTMGIIRQLGDVSMGNAEKLQTLSMIFGQIQSGGRMTGAELMRLIKIGFNPLQIIADKTGESVSDLREKMGKGLFTAEMFRESLQDATGVGGLYNGMIETMANTTEGKFSNIRDAIDQLKLAFGKGFNQGIGAALSYLSNNIPKLEKTFTALGSRIGAAIERYTNILIPKLNVALATLNKVSQLAMQFINALIPQLEKAAGLVGLFVETMVAKVDQMLPKFTKTFSRIGDRIGLAIKNSILGQHDELIGLMQIVGETMGEAMKKGFWMSFRSLWVSMTKGFTMRDRDGTLGLYWDPEKETAPASKAVKELNERSLQELLDNARIRMNQYLHGGERFEPGVGLVRPTRSGEEVDVILNGNTYRLLERIEHNTRIDQPATF